VGRQKQVSETLVLPSNRQLNQRGPERKTLSSLKRERARSDGKKRGGRKSVRCWIRSSYTPKTAKGHG